MNNFFNKTFFLKNNFPSELLSFLHNSVFVVLVFIHLYLLIVLIYLFIYLFIYFLEEWGIMKILMFTETYIPMQDVAYLRKKKTEQFFQQDIFFKE